MQRDDRRIMAAAEFDCASCPQAGFVRTPINEFDGTLHADCGENRDRRRIGAGRIAAHDARLPSVTVLKVNPGPSAIKSELSGMPFSSTRCSTNSAVGADILPNSVSTWRS